ncbi:hypothetical protein [Burkholderia sp. Ax-1719]|uniref:hypothetical protein n=1 Tax=Burkholderia sp. Ax-1719 TaxID=2608334 RepID=UPI00141E480A|nr:hypothetical protein [Burkholderia sp. Ax-1719]NIE62778.1 hypothetical protein [Burkholderia sp. Ax-1719]
MSCEAVSLVASEVLAEFAESVATPLGDASLLLDAPAASWALLCKPSSDNVTLVLDSGAVFAMVSACLPATASALADAFATTAGLEVDDVTCISDYPRLFLAATTLLCLTRHAATTMTFIHLDNDREFEFFSFMPISGI